MKGALHFNLPEEREEFEDAQKGSVYKWRIEEIWQNVFRPAFKHGYGGTHAERLNQLLQDENEQGKLVYEVIEMLADIYHETVREAEK